MQGSGSGVRIVVGDELGFVKTVKLASSLYLTHRGALPAKKTKEKSQQQQQQHYQGFYDNCVEAIAMGRKAVLLGHRNHWMSRLEMALIDGEEEEIEVEKEKGEGEEEEEEEEGEEKKNKKRVVVRMVTLEKVDRVLGVEEETEKVGKERKSGGVVVNTAGGKTRDSLCGMHVIEEDDEDNWSKIVTCTRGGHLVVRKVGDSNDRMLDINLGDFLNNSSSSASTSRAKSEKDSSWFVESMKFNGDKVAVGGKEFDLHVIDVETGEESFMAQNLPNDKLDLPIPIWITDIGWMQENVGNIISTCTGYSEVRLYDVRAQQRPVKNIHLSEFMKHLNTLAVVPPSKEEEGCSSSIIVGDTHGGIRLVDFNKGRMVSKYAGPTGSIRKLAIHPTLPLLASVGLDRYLRVHNYKTRRLVSQIYLKQKLTTVSFLPEHGEDGAHFGTEEDEDGEIRDDDDDEGEEDKGKDNQEEEGDDDDLWNELDKRAKKSKLKR